MEALQNLKSILKPVSLQTVFVRNAKHWSNKKKGRTVPWPGAYAGQQNNYDKNDVEYFPVDPPSVPLTPDGTTYEPSKLHMVWRIQQLKGQPYWVKDIMKNIGLYNKTTLPVIVKNTPSMNQMLWHVKHLVRVKPITFPNGIPTEEDIGSSMLLPTGELVISKKLEVPPEELEPKLDKKRLDYMTLKEHLRLRWLNAYEC